MSENNLDSPITDELGPPKTDFSAPPPYEVTDSNIQPHLPEGNQQQLLTSEQLQHPPQHYSKLPTYEEVQLEKSRNGELPPAFMSSPAIQPTLAPPPNRLYTNICDNNISSNHGSISGPALTFIAIDASDTENFSNGTDNSLLGTDIMFLLAFMIAFLFNWIGFLMLTCFCHTIAARYGALSGFGLSLAKWTLIVKHSTDLASNENSWLWWLIMAFGFLICVRALIQYVSIKRTWRLLSSSAQERLLFFY